MSAVMCREVSGSTRICVKTIDYPRADNHNPAPEYIRLLLGKAQLTQAAAAAILGVDARTVRNYVSGDREIPYPSQFMLECLAKQAEADERTVSGHLADQLIAEDKSLLRRLAK